MTFKNCEPLYYVPVTYVILYISYISVLKSAKRWGGVDNSRRIVKRIKGENRFESDSSRTWHMACRICFPKWVNLFNLKRLNTQKAHVSTFSAGTNQSSSGPILSADGLIVHPRSKRGLLPPTHIHLEKAIFSGANLNPHSNQWLRSSGPVTTVLDVYYHAEKSSI